MFKIASNGRRISDRSCGGLGGSSRSLLALPGLGLLVGEKPLGPLLDLTGSTSRFELLLPDGARVFNKYFYGARMLHYVTLCYKKIEARGR